MAKVGSEIRKPREAPGVPRLLSRRRDISEAPERCCSRILGGDPLLLEITLFHRPVECKFVIQVLFERSWVPLQPIPQVEQVHTPSSTRRTIRAICSNSRSCSSSRCRPLA